MSREKHKNDKNNKNNKIKYIRLVFILIIILGISYTIFYYYNSKKEKQTYQELANNIELPIEEVTATKTERMSKLEELQKENADIKGWIEIERTNISYPVCQADNNDFYLNHNYKKEKASTGSLFLDKDYNFSIPSSNLLIYGHRNKQGLMLEDLLKYKDEEFYKEHKTIRFTTNAEDTDYEILAVFYSRVYYKDEKNVFRYYQFVNAENEAEYNNYVQECKSASIYDTGTTAGYGEQLLTLSTCEYSQEDGRFVVVAKKK